MQGHGHIRGKPLVLRVCFKLYIENLVIATTGGICAVRRTVAVPRASHGLPVNVDLNVRLRGACLRCWARCGAGVWWRCGGGLVRVWWWWWCGEGVGFWSLTARGHRGYSALPYRDAPRTSTDRGCPCTEQSIQNTSPFPFPLSFSTPQMHHGSRHTFQPGPVLALGRNALGIGVGEHN